MKVGKYKICVITGNTEFPEIKKSGILKFQISGNPEKGNSRNTKFLNTGFL